jgi:hypothetical protein
LPQKIGPVRLQAITLRKDTPRMTLEAIAAQCGVTKQRIYKIFKDEGIKKASTPFPNCLQCGIMLGSYDSKFCSERCEVLKYFNRQPCSTCGASIIMRKYILRYKLSKGQYKFFCNRACYAKRNVHINRIMGK